MRQREREKERGTNGLRKMSVVRVGLRCPNEGKHTPTSLAKERAHMAYPKERKRRMDKNGNN